MTYDIDTIVARVRARVGVLQQSGLVLHPLAEAVLANLEERLGHAANDVRFPAQGLTLAEQAYRGTPYSLYASTQVIGDPDQFDLLVQVFADGICCPEFSDQFDAWRACMQALRHARPEGIRLAWLFVELTQPDPTPGGAFIGQVDAFEQHFAHVADVDVPGPEAWQRVSKGLFVAKSRRLCSLAQLLAKLWDVDVDEALHNSPVYRRIERVWNEFLSITLINRGGIFLSHFLKHRRMGDPGLCAPWHQTWPAQALMQAQREFPGLAEPADVEQIRLDDAAAALAEAERQRLATPLADPPGPWHDAAGQPLPTLFEGNFPVYYGQGYIQPPESKVELKYEVRGQVNGLLRAGCTPHLYIATELHTGDVHLSIYRCNSAPPLPGDEWEEVVEASFIIEPGHPVALCDWNGDLAEPLDLPAGTWRVRYGAARFGRAHQGQDGRDPQGRPIERYALAFWPEPEPRADAIVRVTTPHARESHDYARRMNEAWANEATPQ